MPEVRQTLSRLNLAPRRAAALVELRRRLLRGLNEHPSWAGAEVRLLNLLRVLFDPAVLELRRIDELASPAVLASLVKYEAVHAIHGWRELRRRLQADRRCFGLFHPAFPDEPVIFTEVALTRGVAAKVQPLLDPDSPVIDPLSCNCAMFYSISSCHEGLRGVPFGNELIRRVVGTLGKELPWLDTFATVSPVPGFRAWLTTAIEARDRSRAEIVAVVNEDCWPNDVSKSAELERSLVPLCATYLLHAKRGIEPADPVARFHLGNGARLERLNWLGDTSPEGLQRSAGLTANYLYVMSEADRNAESYRRTGTVTASTGIEILAHPR
jgi:malonyl-CoA decarboxylase